MSPTIHQQIQTPTKKCDFCDEFSGGLENSFTARYGSDLKSRIILKTENFSVLPSLGQIVEGYLLIVPTKHYTALADLPMQLVQELSRLCGRVRSALFDTYGPALLFEHGVRAGQSGGCGIEHAHLHAVPFAYAIEPVEELKQRHSFKFIRGISEINNEVPRTSSYLYYENISGQPCVFDVDFVPSQYLRKLLAESAGIDLWDWREYGKERALVSTLTRLAEVLSTHARCGCDRRLIAHFLDTTSV
jgi:diadenosine tetraphosphate (Ap4A) HIT family hydrolase